MTKRIIHSGEIDNSLVEKVYKPGWSELVLCSEGGCIYCARAVVDYLLAHDKKVIGIGQIYMAHFSSADGAAGGAHEMRNHAEELTRWNTWSLELLELRTGTSQDQWVDLMEKEVHFGAKVALELGLVDEIM